MPKTNRRDALSILTDPELQAALERKKQELRARLADFQVNTLMPEWSELTEEQQAPTLKSIEILMDAVLDIEKRLAGASNILRAFSGRELGEQAVEP